MAEIQNVSTMKETEIIEFVSPYQSNKNLYISNITASLNEDEIYNILYETFSKFGLLYGIRIFPVMNSLPPPPPCSSSLLGEEDQSVVGSNPGEDSKRNGKIKAKNEECVEINPTTFYSCYYAFVNFYSYFARQKAKMQLSGNFFINGQPVKISSAKRSKMVDASPILPLSKCQELASYYLGFNGWTTKIKLLKENPLEDNSSNEVSSKKIAFCCLSEVILEHHGILSEGFGAWEETYGINDSFSKIVAYHKARKISYQRSLQDAFSKILLVVLPNGKVAAELNTTKADIFWKEAAISPILQVKELDSQPASEDIEKDLDNSTVDLDDLNIQLLQELEEF